MYKVIAISIDENGREKRKVLYRNKDKSKVENYIDYHEQDISDAGYYAIYIEH